MTLRTPHSALPTPLAWLDDELATLDQAGLLRTRRSYSGAQAATLVVGGRELINFGSNDYLGLANDPRLVDAAWDALGSVGLGAGASPLVTGHSELQRKLESRLAEFEGTEAALTFSSGYAANTGTIAALVGPGDAVFSDERNHASIIDGCRLSRATVQVYAHRDCRQLATLLSSCRDARRRLVASDSVFSMDGDLAPLSELAELARRYDAMLLVDEAHATGVFGRHGRGLAEQLDVEQGVHVRVGTLSKALGCAGGFVSGSHSLIEWLVNRARPYVFSTAPPPAIAAAALAAIEIVQAEPWRREGLLQRAAQLRQRLTDQGWNVLDSASQIIPLVVGDAPQTMTLAARLQERGLVVPGIRPPSVPAGQSLLRISLCHGHTAEMIERLVEELRDAQRGMRADP